jgi:hypothetical protein
MKKKVWYFVILAVLICVIVAALVVVSIIPGVTAMQSFFTGVVLGALFSLWRHYFEY